MNRVSIPIIVASVIVLIAGCEGNVLDTKIDVDTTEEIASQDRGTLWDFANAAYSHNRHGFWVLDVNLIAPVTDDAEQTAAQSQAQLYNEGSWNAFNNPEDYYEGAYRGIRAANFFLERSEDYKNFLALNRDTISTDGKRDYDRDVEDMEWLRNEARVLRAWYYFRLAKRYGGVPLLTRTLSIEEDSHLPRNSFDEIIDFIVSEVDATADGLQEDWKEFDVNRDGRLTKGAALAIKSRALLYAASPLHNSSNDLNKWQAAAAAAQEVIALNQYALDSDYRNLFLEDNSVTSPETIWALRLGQTNTIERSNYPIGTPGGNSGVTPSHNLVSAYEYTAAPDPDDPYANRDPRLAYSIVTNNSTWNERTIEIWEGGADGREKARTSKTGYYLKKFLQSELDLQRDETTLRNWIVFRYAEILLNYAEAMNEAFGPDADNGWGLTAREAVNAVRSRPGVEMPDVVAANQAEMREGIKHERRIELAFEGHRYWDLKRWLDAESVLNQPLLGIRAVQNPDDSFTYTEFTVEERVFIAPKMYLYPIPQTEISKSNGVLEQNAGW